MHTLLEFFLSSGFDRKPCCVPFFSVLCAVAVWLVVLGLGHQPASRYLSNHKILLILTKSKSRNWSGCMPCGAWLSACLYRWVLNTLTTPPSKLRLMAAHRHPGAASKMGRFFMRGVRGEVIGMASPAGAIG